MDDLTSNEAVDEPTGLDRRSLLKKAAVGGAVAFAVPTIISSPAWAQASDTQVRISDTLSVFSTTETGGLGDRVVLQILMPDDDSCVFVSSLWTFNAISQPSVVGYQDYLVTDFTGGVPSAGNMATKVGSGFSGKPNVQSVSIISATPLNAFPPATIIPGVPNTLLYTSKFSVTVTYKVNCGGVCSTITTTATIDFADNETGPTAPSGNGQIVGPVNPGPAGSPALTPPIITPVAC